MAEPPNVRLSLVNTAENIVVVRAVLAGLAESAGVDAGELDDIRTAVSEACNNVVMHAYEGELGAMDVSIELGEDAMLVIIRDRGIGIGEHAREDGPYADGIGLHVIRTLTSEVRFQEPPGGGTLVSMELPARGLGAQQPRLVCGPDLDLTGMMPRFTAAISIAPVSLARSILPRLASTLAARAHFSTDRLSDVQLLTDALTAHAAGAVCAQHVSFGISVQPRDLELRIAPLRLGQAKGLVRASDLDGLGRIIEKLADRHDVLTAESHETLALSMLDQRRR